MAGTTLMVGDDGAAGVPETLVEAVPAPAAFTALRAKL